MDPAAARALMPSWVAPFSVLVHAAAAGALACGVGALLCALGRRAFARRAPWPLRARALVVPRFALDVSFLLFAIPLAFATRRQGFLGGAPSMAAMAAAVLVLSLWRWRLTRTLVGHDHGLRRACAAVATRALVLCPELWAILPLAIAIPWRADLAAALVFATPILARVMLLAGALPAPAPPEIAQEVEAAAAKAGIRLDGVCQIDLPEANAYALPFARRIAFTRAALWKIDRAALVALAQLEIRRLRGRRASMLTAVFLVLAAPFAAKAADVPTAAAAAVAIALAFALRRRPFPFDARFDAEAAAAETAPGDYARALAETHRLDLVPAVVRVATGQPNLHDRLAALGAPLPYPRPRAPSFSLFLALIVLAATASVAANIWPIAATHGGPWTAAALSATDAWFVAPLGDLAYARHVERRYDEAAVLYGAAAALAPDDPVWPAHQCMSLAAAGRVTEAERALAEAEHRGADQELLARARERIKGRR